MIFVEFTLGALWLCIFFVSSLYWIVFLFGKGIYSQASRSCTGSRNVLEDPVITVKEGQDLPGVKCLKRGKSKDKFQM